MAKLFYFPFAVHRNSKAITQPKARLSKGSKLGATWKWYNTLTGLVLTQRDRFSAMKFRPERFHVVAKRPRLLRNAYLRCSSPSNRFHNSFRFLPPFRRFDQFFSSSLFFFFPFSALFRWPSVNGLNFPSQLRLAGWNRRENIKMHGHACAVAIGDFFKTVNQRIRECETLRNMFYIYVFVGFLCNLL